jgi:hypothetical protein
MDLLVRICYYPVSCTPSDAQRVRHLVFSQWEHLGEIGTIVSSITPMPFSELVKAHPPE